MDTSATLASLITYKLIVSSRTGRGRLVNSCGHQSRYDHVSYLETVGLCVIVLFAHVTRLME